MTAPKQTKNKLKIAKSTISSPAKVDDSVHKADKLKAATSAKPHPLSLDEAIDDFEGVHPLIKQKSKKKNKKKY